MKPLALAIAATAYANAAAACVLGLGLIWPPLEGILNVAPFMLACALAVVAGAALLGVRRHVLIAAALAVITPIGLVGPELLAHIAQSRLAAHTDGPRLKVLTANLWNANTSYAAAIDLIRREQPDIVVLEEAWRPWGEVLHTLAPAYRIVAGCENGYDCNVVVLSRLPALAASARAEGALASVVLQLPDRLGGGTMEVLGVHLTRAPHNDAQRLELAELVAQSQHFSPRAIVAGDFNATPWSTKLRRLDRMLGLRRVTRALFSWPTPARRFSRWRLAFPFAGAPIDHVYAGQAWRAVDVHRGPEIGSDHYPIIASFMLSAETPRSSPVARSGRAIDGKR